MELHPSNWPEEYMCPISRSVMAEPVVVSSGQTYERRCIEAWLELGQTRCVVHDIPLDPYMIIPNIFVKSAIAKRARSNGMQFLPVPPSPELACALAKRLVYELEAIRLASYTSNLSQTEGNCIIDAEGISQKDEKSHFDEEQCRVAPENINNQSELDFGHVSHHGKEEAKRVAVALDELACDSSQSSPCSHPAEAIANTPARTDADSACPQSEHGAHIKLFKGQKGVSRVQHNTWVTPIRYSHSVSEVLLEASYGSDHELPPNLVTKPSSCCPVEVPSTPLPPASLSAVLSSLIQRLQDPMPEEHEDAVSKLRQLTRMSPENRVSLCCPDIIQSLLPHLKSRYPATQVNSVAALVNFSLEKQNKIMIMRSGAVPFLVELLKVGVPEAQEHAAGAIFSLSLEDENKDPIGVLNAIPPLVHLLQSKRPGARQDAAMALYQLSLFQTNRSKLLKVGAVPILLNLAESKENPDLAGRALSILANVAAMPEGRSTLLEHNAINRLVKLLMVPPNKSPLHASEHIVKSRKNAAHVQEQAVAVLLVLSKKKPEVQTHGTACWGSGTTDHPV